MEWIRFQWNPLHTIGYRSTAGRPPGTGGKGCRGFHYNPVDDTNHPEVIKMPHCAACGAEPEPPVRAPHTVYVKTLYASPAMATAATTSSGPPWPPA